MAILISRPRKGKVMSSIHYGPSIDIRKLLKQRGGELGHERDNAGVNKGCSYNIFNTYLQLHM